MNLAAIRRIVLIGVPILILLGLGFWLIPRPAPECPITPASEQDLQEALRPGVRVFEADGWIVETGEQQAMVSVLWTSTESEALAHSQLLLYNCGYTDAQINQFYGNDGLAVMYGGYESWQQTASCEAGGITLREFDLVLDGKPFKSRMWVEPVSETRVRDLRIDFPADDIAGLDDYSARLYPELITCGS